MSVSPTEVAPGAVTARRRSDTVDEIAPRRLPVLVNSALVGAVSVPVGIIGFAMLTGMWMSDWSTEYFARISVVGLLVAAAWGLAVDVPLRLLAARRGWSRILSIAAALTVLLAAIGIGTPLLPQPLAGEQFSPAAVLGIWAVVSLLPFALYTAVVSFGARMRIVARWGWLIATVFGLAAAVAWRFG